MQLEIDIPVDPYTDSELQLIANKLYQLCPDIKSYIEHTMKRIQSNNDDIFTYDFAENIIDEITSSVELTGCVNAYLTVLYSEVVNSYVFHEKDSVILALDKLLTSISSIH